MAPSLVSIIMEQAFRPLLKHECELIEKLLEPEFAGRDQLRAQRHRVHRVYVVLHDTEQGQGHALTPFNGSTALVRCVTRVDPLKIRTLAGLGQADQSNARM